METRDYIQDLEERYDETFRHRSLGRNVSYKHLIKLECYKLLKDILGIEEYKTFKMYCFILCLCSRLRFTYPLGIDK